jgi:predicted ferric reductase
MSKGLWRIVLYALLLLAPLLIATLVSPGIRHQHGILYEVAKNLALIGFMILMLQPVLAGRFKWIEAPFGMDILIRFHKHMAVFAVCLLILHPILLAAGGAGWTLLFGLDLPWYIWVGKGALVLLLINAALSLFQQRFGISFEKWRLSHDIIGPLILVMIFFHSYFVGHNLKSPPLSWIWPLLLIASAAIFVYHRFVRPRKLATAPYRVTEVVPEAADVWTVKLTPPEGKNVGDYYPGQFHFITFHRREDLPEEEHHWTISSSPTESGFVSSTIKALGDFTQTMGETQPGDTATLHGPFGRFSYLLHPDEQELVFIAGGIGVTPLRAMLRHMTDTEADRAVRFLYANKEEKGIVFREELETIAGGERPRLQLIHVLENPGEGWSGETGYVDREKIERLCGDWIDRAGFYVCGPPGLTQAAIGHLKDLGVPDHRIHLELFSFLD